MAAPIFAVIFFYGMGLLQFKTLKECWVEFRHKFPMVYLVGTNLSKSLAVQTETIFSSIG